MIIIFKTRSSRVVTLPSPPFGGATFPWQGKELFVLLFAILLQILNFTKPTFVYRNSKAVPKSSPPFLKEGWLRGSGDGVVRRTTILLWN